MYTALTVTYRYQSRDGCGHVSPFHNHCMPRYCIFPTYPTNNHHHPPTTPTTRTITPSSFISTTHFLPLLAHLIVTNIINN